MLAHLTRLHVHAFARVSLELSWVASLQHAAERVRCMVQVVGARDRGGQAQAVVADSSQRRLQVPPCTWPCHSSAGARFPVIMLRPELDFAAGCAQRAHTPDQPGAGESTQPAAAAAP